MEKDWVLSHIALHVRDLDEIAAYYESIGIGVHLPIKPACAFPRHQSAGDAESKVS